MEHFGVGYFPRRGSMQGRIVIPIHNADGELVAYAGRKPEEADAPYKYPENFTRSLELYNLHRAWESGKLADDGVIIVPDFFDVFRLFEAGYQNVLALMGEELAPEQLLTLDEWHPGGRVTLFLPSSLPPRVVVELVNALIGSFYVRLVRPAAKGVRSIARLPVGELRELIRGNDTDREVRHAAAG
jgi:hypothetical protein